MIKYLQNDKYKTIQFSFYFMAEIESDAFAYRFLLARLLKSHTLSCPTQVEFNKKLADLYNLVIKDSFYLLGDKMISKFTITMTDYHFVDDASLLPKVVDFIKETLFDRSSFDETCFGNVKRLCLEHIATIKDRKYQYGKDQFIKHVYPHQAISHPLTGTYEELKQIDLASLLYYYQNYFMYPVMMIVDGNFSHADEAYMDQVLGEFCSPDQKVGPNNFELGSITDTNELVPTPSASIYLGYSLPISIHDNLYYPAVLVSTMLGGHPDSWLFRIFREELGLSYDVDCDFNSDNQLLTVYASVDNKECFETKEILKNVVAEFIAKGGTNEALTTAKEFLISMLESAYDRQQRKTFEVFTAACQNRDISAAQSIKKIKAVTLESILDVMSLITLNTAYVLHGDEYET